MSPRDHSGAIWIDGEGCAEAERYKLIRYVCGLHSGEGSIGGKRYSSYGGGRDIRTHGFRAFAWGKKTVCPESIGASIVVALHCARADEVSVSAAVAKIIRSMGMLWWRESLLVPP